VTVVGKKHLGQRLYLFIHLLPENPG